MDEFTKLVWISIIFVIASIVYIIIIVYCAKNRLWIFAPYVPPPLPGGFQPYGAVIPLTPEEIQQRQELVARILNS